MRVGVSVRAGGMIVSLLLLRTSDPNGEEQSVPHSSAIKPSRLIRYGMAVLWIAWGLGLRVAWGYRERDDYGTWLWQFRAFRSPAGFYSTQQLDDRTSYIGDVIVKEGVGPGPRLPTVLAPCTWYERRVFVAESGSSDLYPILSRAEMREALANFRPSSESSDYARIAAVVGTGRFQVTRWIPRNLAIGVLIQLWMLCGVPVAFAVARAVRRRVRGANGKCPECGYDISGSALGCPECGAP